MYSEEDVALHAEALGVVAALISAAADDVSRKNLEDAYQSLEAVYPELVDPPAAAAVGAHRRISDFAKLQELLMRLSLCRGADQSAVIRTMMLVTRAESHWVSPPPASRRGFSLRRGTDRTTSSA